MHRGGYGVSQTDVFATPGHSGGTVASVKTPDKDRAKTPEDGHSRRLMAARLAAQHPQNDRTIALGRKNGTVNLVQRDQLRVHMA